MTTPPRPEADMLHMQHAQLAALLARQQEAARLRGAARRRRREDPRRRRARARNRARARPATPRKVRVHGPRPA